MIRRPILAAAMTTAVWTAAWAGDTNPPPGPIGPTMKPLDQVEPRTPITSLPFTISEPGSYYLVGNLETAGDGIIVDASDVTIDMMGFSITGTSPDTNVGVRVNSFTHENFTLINGTVRRFYEGVTANTFEAGNGVTVTGVRAVDVGLSGIDVRGTNNLVRDCFAVRSTSATVMFLSTGIVVTGGVIENCRASGFDTGIGGVDGAVISNSSAVECVTGFVVLQGVIKGCAAFDCSQSLTLGSGSVSVDNYLP